MSRRRKTIFEDIIEITAMLPWWAGIMLAFISYLVLHTFAGVRVELSTDTTQIGGFVAGQLIASAARIFQYLMPVVFTMGAVNSFVQQKKKNKLYGHLKKNPAIRSLQEMNWQEFELLIGRYFEEKGYAIRQLAQPGPDGGVDLVVIKDNEKKSGISIHFVNEKYDEGKIVFQAKCNVDISDTPEKLAERIHLLEYEHFPKIIEKLLVDNKT